MIKIFEITIPRLFSSLEWGEDDTMWKSKYMDEHFIRVSGEGGSMKPLNYDFIINDNYYFSMITKYNNQRVYFNNHLNTTLEENKRVLQLIKQELQGANRS